ncbi:MAG: hypothetical protein QGH34_02635 [Candidatus Woesearchaeota archaeon]|jgi:chromosome segregation ATPase|nr:hypothetical protein [Candidatus Woesearchaeota archaeon]
MAFMKRDVNLGLLILIVFSIIIFSAFSVYYQTTFQDVSLEYQQKLEQLGKVTKELGTKRQELNETYSLKLKAEEDKRVLDQRYKEASDENTGLRSDLISTKVQLAEKSSELVETQNSLAQREASLIAANSEIASKNSKIGNLNDEIECLETEAAKDDADENTGSC